jgi:hypothetical protein
MDRYSQGSRGASADAPFWLKAYEAGRHDVDRSDPSKSFAVAALSVSILGGIQPAVLAKIGDGLTGDGMLARFLFAVVNGRHECLDLPPEPEGASHYAEVMRFLSELESVTLTASPEAAEINIAAERWALTEMRKHDPDAAIQGVLGKAHGQVARLTGVLHLIEQATGAVLMGIEPNDFDMGIETVVSGETAASAWRLFQTYLWPNGKLMYALIEGETAARADVRALACWILDSAAAGQGVRLGDLRQMKRFRGRTNDDRFWAAASALEAANWMTRVELKKGFAGRPAIEWTVNPKVFDGRFARHQTQAAA